jgi:hypothetical protein
VLPADSITIFDSDLSSMEGLNRDRVTAKVTTFVFVLVCWLAGGENTIPGPMFVVLFLLPPCSGSSSLLVLPIDFKGISTATVPPHGISIRMPASPEPDDIYSLIRQLKEDGLPTVR